MGRDGEMYRGTLVSTFGAASEWGGCAGGGGVDHTDRYRPELWMRSEKWRHSTGFSHPPTSGHTHTHTPNHTCYTQTIFSTRAKSLRGCTHSHCSSNPPPPNTQVHLKTWFHHTVSHSNTHTFSEALAVHALLKPS